MPRKVEIFGTRDRIAVQTQQKLKNTTQLSTSSFYQSTPLCPSQLILSNGSTMFARSTVCHSSTGEFAFQVTQWIWPPVANSALHARADVSTLPGELAKGHTRLLLASWRFEHPFSIGSLRMAFSSFRRFAGANMLICNAFARSLGQVPKIISELVRKVRSPLFL